MPVYVFKNSKKDVSPWVTTAEDDRAAELLAAGWADEGWLLVTDDDEASSEITKSQTTAEATAKASTSAAKPSTTKKD